uniref:Bicarbonate transporter-like transmembrane domain-containing protein n=1 Tax=Panagrolaimus sp. JU765 TaxID=591449 RepID=A0AC34QI45_9BILA
MGKVFPSCQELGKSQNSDVEAAFRRSRPEKNEKIYLLNSTQQTLPLKNFFVEVRGILDVEHLLDNAVVLLDVHKTDIDDIVRLMAESIPDVRDSILYSDLQNSVFSYSELENIKGKISSDFKVDDFSVTCIRQKLQGVCLEADNVVVDQSWLTI